MVKYLILFSCLLFVQNLQSQFGDLGTFDKKYRDEVVTLANKPIVKKTFAYIQSEDEQTIKNLIYLTEIPAPPFKEEKRAAAFKDMIQSIGVDSVWIDEVGNVLALRKGKNGKKTIALDAHLDTVFPEGTDVTVKMRGDTLFAPGINDDTKGLANLLTILKSLNKNKIETDHDILFVGTVGEEGLGDLRGVKHLFRDGGPAIDSWIAVDGGTIGRVNNKGLGSYRYRVTFRGPGGHSWGAFGLANPHHALGKAISLFVERADKFTSYGDRTSYNVGVIKGGTSVNSIPFESSMEIDMRSVSPARLDSIDTILKTAIQDALAYQNGLNRIGDKLTVDVDQIGNRPSGELSEKLPLIQKAMACTALFGKRPRLTRGSTNSNIPISLGIPAVTVGRGGEGANAHSLDEWWINKEGHRAIQFTLLLLLSESGIID